MTRRCRPISSRFKAHVCHSRRVERTVLYARHDTVEVVTIGNGTGIPRLHALYIRPPLCGHWREIGDETFQVGLSKSTVSTVGVSGVKEANETTPSFDAHGAGETTRTVADGACFITPFMGRLGWVCTVYGALHGFARLLCGRPHLLYRVGSCNERERERE